MKFDLKERIYKDLNFLKETFRIGHRNVYDLLNLVMSFLKIHKLVLYHCYVEFNNTGQKFYRKGVHSLS